MLSIRFVGGPENGREVTVSHEDMPEAVSENRFPVELFSASGTYRLHTAGAGIWEYAWVEQAEIELGTT